MFFFRFNGLRFRFRDDKEDANGDWHDDGNGRYVSHGGAEANKTDNEKKVAKKSITISGEENSQYEYPFPGNSIVQRKKRDLDRRRPRKHSNRKYAIGSFEYTEINIPAKEYSRLIRELNTNYNGRFRKTIGSVNNITIGQYEYFFINLGFDQYIFIDRIFTG